MTFRTLFATLLCCAAASAASFPVTVFTDTVSGGAAGTGAGLAGDLRSQIIAANAFGGAGNTIAFVCNTPPCTITLNGPLPPITSNLTIDGGTFGNIIIDGNSLYRVFFVDSGTVTIANLQIQNMLAQGGAGGKNGGGGGAGFGAGLFVNQATASVAVRSTFFKNGSAVGGKGGDGVADVGTADSGGGGGGLGFAGANGDTTDNFRGGGGGGGVTGSGGTFSGLIGGNGGAGGGGAGGSNGNVGNGSGGSAYAGNGAGAGGATHQAGNGGFGGGGGGGDVAGNGGNGGFGGGGGGGGDGAGGSAGSGGFGGGGGSGLNAGGSSLAAVGGIHGGSGGAGDNNVTSGGGGGGAAAGTAIFVNLGSVTTLNSTSGGALSETVGLGGAAGGAGASAGSNGTGDPNPVFNYAGTVNGSGATGSSLAPLPFGVMPATHFSVVALTPVTSFVNNGAGVTVTALDSTGATATGYNGTVHLTSSDPGFVNATGDTTLTNGVGSFNFALKTAGVQTITATDTVLSNITGVSNNVTVNPGPAVRLVVSAPASASPGTAFNVTVTAQDLFGNTATGYAGTVHFTSTDGAATLPANSTLVSGVGTFSVTLRTAGAQTITATDTVTGSITGTSGNIQVLGTAPTISMSFAPSTVEVFGSSTTTLTVTVTNPNAFALTGLGFSDSYPAGITPDNVTAFTCGGVGSSGVFNAAGFTYSNVTLGAGSACHVSVAVHATTTGLKTDTTSTVTSNEALTGAAGSANLTVNPDSPPTLGEAFGAGSVTVGASTSLTFTVTNPNLTIPISAVGFTDTLPGGLAVASPNGIANTCGGTATAVVGSNSITLSAVALAPNTSCTLAVSVTATAPGVQTNTTGAPTSNVGSGVAATASVTVGALTQTVTFNRLPFHAYGDAPFTISASASSGLPITFQVLQNGVCSVSQGTSVTVTLTGAGFCQITALQPGNNVYDSASVTQAFSVSKAPLTVTAKNASMTAGGPLPAFSPSFAGFVNGDTAAAVTGAPAFTTTATISSLPGVYPITVSAGTLASANYSFLFVGGALTVTPGGANSLTNSGSLAVASVAANTLLTLFNPPANCTNPQVLIDGVAAQVLFANAAQINFVAPATVASESAATLQVICAGTPSETILVPVAPVSPGIFTLTGTGTGQAAVINQNGTINGAANPAPRNSYISLYVTGFGSYQAVGADGLMRTTYTVTASIGGIAANVSYAGNAPTEVLAVQQINVQIPANAPVGAAVPIVLSVDGASTATGVTVAIQ